MNVIPINNFSNQSNHKHNFNPCFGLRFTPELKTFLKQAKNQLPSEEGKKISKTVKYLDKQKVLPGWIIGISEKNNTFNITAMRKKDKHVIEQPIVIWNLTDSSAPVSEKVNAILSCMADNLERFTNHAKYIFNRRFEVANTIKLRQQEKEKLAKMRKEFYAQCSPAARPSDWDK